eukprot:16437627-Heterocapsa_arctica.AAC.1
MGSSFPIKGIMIFGDGLLDELHAPDADLARREVHDVEAVAGQAVEQGEADDLVLEDRAVGTPDGRLAHPTVMATEEPSRASERSAPHDVGGGAGPRERHEDGAVLDHVLGELHDVAGDTRNGNGHGARVVAQESTT